MRKLKLIIVSVLFCMMGYAGYTAYDYIATSKTQKYILANVEAITEPEPGGDFRYPDRYGDADYCTLFQYVNIKTNAKINATSPNPSLDANVEWVRSTIRGLEDNCPRNGNGCNPFSCQEIPY